MGGYTNVVVTGVLWDPCTTRTTNYTIYPSPWSINIPGYFTLTSGQPTSRMAGTSGGTSYFYTPFVSTIYAFDGHGCFVPEQRPLNPGGNGTTIPISITRDKNLWYFDGLNPTGFTLGATQATLTVQNAGQGEFQWNITTGSDKANFANGQTYVDNTSSSIAIYARKASTSVSDTVIVQVRYLPSQGMSQVTTTTLTVESPYKLVSRGATTHSGRGNSCSVSGTQGFQSRVPYQIRSRINNVIVTNVDVNEHFSDQIDFVANNWGSFASRVAPLFATTGEFDDALCITTNIFNPNPTPPMSPLGNASVQAANQDWHVGSSTSGSGTHIQSNTVKLYIDHGVHSNVVSPVN